MAADESTEHAGLAAATETGPAAHDAAGAHQHLATQLPEEEGQNRAVPEQGVCDAQQIHGVTFQAPGEAGPPAAGFTRPNDGEEGTEHAPVVAAAIADDTTRDREEVPEPESVPQLADPLSTATETGSTGTAAADDAQAHQDSQHRRRPISLGFALGFIDNVRDLREPGGNPDNDNEVFALAVEMTLRSRLPWLRELPSYRNGGFGAVPASAAAVAGLEKRVFHAGGDDHGGCGICLEDEFEEDQELSVMPCAQAHAFHTACITAWLGQSNMCPLCRHALPASED